MSAALRKTSTRASASTAAATGQAPKPEPVSKKRKAPGEEGGVGAGGEGERPATTAQASSSSRFNKPAGNPRCDWAFLKGKNADLNTKYLKYHDEEWGVPVHDDKVFFEFLTLEGAQAGLSWSTVLAKRDAYRAAFHQFDPTKVAQMTAADVDRLLLPESGIIRHRGKIESTISNAKLVLAVQREFGSLDRYIWSFVPDSKPIINQPRTMEDVPTVTEEARALSRALKGRGFKFVGETIIYAFMQAVGMVDDHLLGCPCKHNQ